VYGVVFASNQDVVPINVGPVDAFLVVFQLFQRENVTVEVLLQLLVRVVDVELLKAISTCHLAKNKHAKAVML
jgi:hypothetical protein